MKNKEIIIKAVNIKDFISSLPKEGKFGEKIFFNNNESILGFKIITSKEPSKSESHDNFTDVFLVQEGSEEFFIGGEIVNKELKAVGEWIGSDISGARKYIIEAGDVVIIPKGIPHMHGNGVIKSVVIKIK